MPLEAIWTKLKLITVEPVVFLYMFIILMESNALQNLILVKTCISDLTLNGTGPLDIRNCNHHKKEFGDQVIADATTWIKYNSVFLFLFQFSSSLFVASWADKFGRKFPMLIPPLGTMISASINCILSAFIQTSPALLFISSTISGLTFGTVGIVSATFGFVTDISDSSSRTKRMVIMEIMLFSGSAIGTYVAGVFLEYPDYQLKVNGFTRLFAFEGFMACLIICYILFRIPSYSGSSTGRSPLTLRNLFKLDNVYECVRTVFRPREGKNRMTVLLLLLVLFLISSALVVMTILSFLFLSQQHWDFTKFTIFSSIQTELKGAALIVMPALLYYYQIQDHLLAMIGILSKMVGVLLFGLSSNDSIVYSSMVLAMFSEYSVPPIRSILSKVVDPNEVGKIFALTSILPSFCFLIGSLALASVFQATVSFFPGLCFEIVAGLQFCALLIMIYLYFTREKIVSTYRIMEHEDGSVTETYVEGRESYNS